MKAKDSYLHGSGQVWDELFLDRDLTYTEVADTQGKLFELVKIGFLEEIFPKKGKMLEVGCGTAFVSLYFAKRGFGAYCLDANEKVLAVAKKNFKAEKVGGKFFVGNAEKLPFKDGEFDIVASFGLLEHFANPQQVVDEMVRVAKKGGLVFADIVPERFSVQTIGNFFNFLVTCCYWTLKAEPQKGWENALRNFQPLYFENKFGWGEYQSMFAKAGLKSVEVRGNRPFPRLTLPFFLDRIYTKLLKVFLPLWKDFDRSGSEVSLTWGAGYWIWGRKML